MKVVVAELIWPEGLAELEASATVEYDPEMWRDPGTLRKKVETADALIVRNQTRVDSTLLQSGGSLRVVGRLGVGLDNIDLDTARDRNIPIVFARNANAVAVAEYVIAAILDRSRTLRDANDDVRAGNWDRRRFTGTEVHGKTLGLVGVGEIAQRVARRAVAFGMRVVGYDPYVAPFDYPVVETGVELMGLHDVLGASDFVSLHVPLNPGTRGLFSLPNLRKMKPGAWLINTSRGGVIDEADLSLALDEGLIGGVVLDVLEQEPVREDNPLLKQENVLLTPHVAGLTEESQVNTSVLVAREVMKVLRGEPSLCVVG